MSVENVVSLLGALRKASSPLTKAKLLALTVRGVRQLSSWERRELLTRLGVEKSDWFVDRLGEESNETTAELVRELIKQAGKTDPSKWQELASKLRDPEERGRLLAEGLEMLDELPADQGSGAAAAQTPPPPVAESGAPEELPPTLSLKPPQPLESDRVRSPEVARAVPPPEEKPPAPKKTAPGSSPPTKPVSVEPPLKPAPGLPAAAPVTPPPAARKPAPAAKKPVPPPSKPRTRAPARFAQPRRPPPSTPPRKAAPKPGKSAAESRRGPRVAARPDKTRPAKDSALAEPLSRALVEELAATPLLVRRFRLLREKADGTRDWSPEALRVLVEVFPDGWARRRALATLFAAGAPADFETALGLVTQTLESPTDRGWCLGALATGHELTAHQREALLAGLESPSWRRRLSKRLAADT